MVIILSLLFEILRRQIRSHDCVSLSNSPRSHQRTTFQLTVCRSVNAAILLGQTLLSIGWTWVNKNDHRLHSNLVVTQLCQLTSHLLHLLYYSTHDIVQMFLLIIPVFSVLCHPIWAIATRHPDPGGVLDTRYLEELTIPLAVHLWISVHASVYFVHCLCSVVSGLTGKKPSQIDCSLIRSVTACLSAKSTSADHCDEQMESLRRTSGDFSPTSSAAAAAAAAGLVHEHNANYFRLTNIFCS